MTTLKPLPIVEFPADPSPELPIPRLEIRWKRLSKKDQERGYISVAEYSLVYKHLCDQIVFVPLGKTRSTSDFLELINWDESIRIPFRDGCHIEHDAKQMGLPAFIVHGKRFKKL